MDSGFRGNEVMRRPSTGSGRTGVVGSGWTEGRGAVDQDVQLAAEDVDFVLGHGDAAVFRHGAG